MHGCCRAGEIVKCRYIVVDTLQSNMYFYSRIMADNNPVLHSTDWLPHNCHRVVQFSVPHPLHPPRSTIDQQSRRRRRRQIVVEYFVAKAPTTNRARGWKWLEWSWSPIVSSHNSAEPTTATTTWLDYCFNIILHIHIGAHRAGKV